jgi:DNA-binding NtrC family response regulator
MVARELARILVVDDETAIRRTLEVLLGRRGYTVATAANGEEAIAWLLQRTFDLLLIDLKMPGMDGLAVAESARRCQPTARVVFFTGSTDFNGISIEEQVGHFDYILKTASPHEVLEQVARVLDKPPELN